MYAFVKSDTQDAGVAELILLDSNMLAPYGEVQIKTVFSVQLFAPSHYFLSLWLKYSPRHPLTPF